MVANTLPTTEQRAKVLVIDDDEDQCRLIADGLDADVSWCLTATEGVSRATHEEFDVVLADLNLSGDDNGLDVCARLAQQAPDLPVIVVTGFGSMESAVQALRVGAYDFISKPVELVALAAAVRRAARHRRLEREVARLKDRLELGTSLGQMVGNSQPMQRVYDLIRRASGSDVSVLVTGESGTGKELAARALHAGSERKHRPFVAINCAAVPATLIESELFGHVKGAFTDAKGARKGLFLEASGGTVLLDEIGELPIEMQPKLLRVLQERKLRPVGGQTETEIDVRIVAATNRDLEEEVEAGRFREDLYYRLNVVELHLPPLRVRGNDVLLLAQLFLEQAAAESSKHVTGMTNDTAAKLLGYDWPGNVRQLQNTMQRAVALTRYEKVTPSDLPERVRGHVGTRIDELEPHPEHLLTLSELEHRYIEKVLKLLSGNKTQTAKVLGVDRRSLYRKLKRFRESAESNAA